MQTVILAGGKGRRLEPLTKDVPKPLIAIRGKPFLQYQLEFIKSFGLKKILLLVGYLGEKIQDYFGSGSKLGLNIDYSYEKTSLGTAGPLKLAQNKLEDKFLLINGDTYLDIDYKELINFFSQCNTKGLITLYDNSKKIAPNNVAIDNQGLVTAYNRHQPKAMTHLDAGVMVFKKSILDLIPPGKASSLEESVFYNLIIEKELRYFITDREFYDIGTPQKLEIIKEVLK